MLEITKKFTLTKQEFSDLNKVKEQIFQGAQQYAIHFEKGNFSGVRTDCEQSVKSVQSPKYDYLIHFYETSDPNNRCFATLAVHLDVID